MRNNIAAALIFLIAFGVYLYTMAPSVAGDDSGEQAAVGATLGTGHPPGYPLYTLISRATVTLVPWANPAYRVNLVSALFIAASAAVMFFLIMALSRGFIASAVLSLSFAFSSLVWAMANVTEAYGVAAFVVCLIALLMLKDPPENAEEIPAYRYCALAFLFGIGLAAHYTIALLAPGFLWWAYLVLRPSSGRIARSYLWTGAFFFAAGFSIMLYLYVRGRTQPVFGWEDPSTPGRFWQVAARLRYGTLSLAQGGAPPLSLSIIWGKLSFFVATLADNFTAVGAFLFAAGAFLALKDKRKGWTLLLLLLGSGPGFLLLANADLGPHAKALLDRFFFLPFIFVVLIMAFPFRKLHAAAACAAFFIPGYLLAFNFDGLDHREDFLFYDSAKNILRTAPLNAVILSDRADEMEFCVAYLLGAEARRPDLDFIDCNAGITRSIYGNDYYRIWGKPRLALRERVENDLISRSQRPVYYASFQQLIPGPARVQEGLLFRVTAQGQGRRSFPFGDVYSYRLSSIPDHRDARCVNNIFAFYHLLGQYYLDIGDIENSERCFRGVTAYDSSGRWAPTIGYLYHNKGRLDIAQAYYERAAESGTATPDIVTNLGAIYESQGNTGLAEQLYRTVLDRDPDNVQAHYNLAVLFWRRNDWKEVMRELETVVRLDPAHADAQRYLALARDRARGN